MGEVLEKRYGFDKLSKIEMSKARFCCHNDQIVRTSNKMLMNEAIPKDTAHVYLCGLIANTDARYDTSTEKASSVASQYSSLENLEINGFSYEMKEIDKSP